MSISPYILTLVSFLLFQTAQAGEIYRHIDKKGNIHFSDKKPISIKKHGRKQTASLNNANVRIYRFIDKTGTIHLTDEPNHAGYKLVYKGNGSVKSRYSRLKNVNIHRKYKVYADIISDVANSYALEPALLHAVIQTESAYNPKARSPKGAVGLMQLMPGTAKRYGVTDRTNATQSINGGARYLKFLLKLFKNNKRLALAGYNAGENAVIRYGHKIPPYRETRNYVKRVMAIYNKHKERS